MPYAYAWICLALVQFVLRFVFVVRLCFSWGRWLKKSVSLCARYQTNSYRAFGYVFLQIRLLLSLRSLSVLPSLSSFFPFLRLFSQCHFSKKFIFLLLYAQAHNLPVGEWTWVRLKQYPYIFISTSHLNRERERERGPKELKKTKCDDFVEPTQRLRNQYKFSFVTVNGFIF